MGTQGKKLYNKIIKPKSYMTLKETIKDILLTVNTQMSEEKADMWTNIILLAIEQDKDKETFKMVDDMYKKEQMCVHGLPQLHCSTCQNVMNQTRVIDDEETVASL